MRNTVTRTFIKNTAAVVLYVDGKIKNDHIDVPATYNTPSLAEKYIRNKVKNLDGILVKVESVEKVEQLYGMPERLFIKLARPVPERSKETRGMTSKTIIGKAGTLLYMTPDRKVEEKIVTFFADEKLSDVGKREAPEGCFPIDIVNITDTEAIYVISDDDFIKNARLMSDHQHYII